MIVRRGLSSSLARLAGSHSSPFVIDSTIDHSKIELFDLNRYFEGAVVKGELRPIVGNEGIRMGPVLTWGIQKKSVLLQGESGSAKTEIMNASIVLLFEDLGLEGDNSALYMFDTSSDYGQLNLFMKRKIECAGWCFVPELQNAENQMPIFKKWMEGKPFVRTRTKQGSRDDAEEIKLPPRPILSCIAIGNEIMATVPEEVKRRMVHYWTVSDYETNKAVHFMKARNRALPDEKLPIMPPDTLYMLRTKLHSAMIDSRRVINPYGTVVQEYIPKRFTSSNSYVDYFLDTIDAITKFYASTRISTDRYIFANMADNFYAMEIFGDTFVNMCLGIDEIGRELAKKFPFKPRIKFGDMEAQGVDVSKDTDYLTLADVMGKASDLGYHRSQTIVKETLEKLIDSGYLDRVVVGKKEYYVRYADIETASLIDWERAQLIGSNWMKEYFPEQYGEWSESDLFSYVTPIGPNAGSRGKLL